ncbi:MAG TPA: ATP-binding protein [Bryobacteraceae bacterium]|nr:ATP-binding protein [Bryobacteraceae bacterium]
MPEAESPKILIVGDETSRDALIEIFGQRGWHIDTAVTAADAVTLLQGAWFDLVLIDIDLAAGDCGDWLRRMRVLRPETRLIVITAESTPANVVCAIREQAFGYFTKPFSPEAVAELVAQALETPSWHDDIQLISASPNWITVRLRCKIEAAERLVQFLREIKSDLDPERREDIAAALRELVLNAIEHGGHNDPQQYIRVSYVRTSRAIVYHIQDPGPGFSFSRLSHAAVANPPDDPARHAEIREEQGVRPGGFGILLTRNLVDELLYSEKGNEVLFIKYLKDGELKDRG